MMAKPPKGASPLKPPELLRGAEPPPGVEGTEFPAEPLLTHDFVTLEERDISPDVDIMMPVPRRFFSIDRS